jgi:hypothetical protein
MNAYVMTYRAEYTIADADRLKVNGELVEIQRQIANQDEFVTIAVVGHGDLGLVSLGQDPAEHELGGRPPTDPEQVSRPMSERDYEPCTYEPW